MRADDADGRGRISGTRHDSRGKPPLGELPPEAAVAFAAVARYGAQKYGDMNWALGTQWSEMVHSALRHLWQGWYWTGDADWESGQNHLYHALWNIVCLIFYQTHGLGVDDRPWQRIIRVRERGEPDESR